MNRKNIIEFGRAQVSSAIATASDFLTTAIVFHLTAHVMMSAAIGATTGGIVNCAINYKWTFPGAQRGKKTIAWRFLLVWAFSLILNTFGTDYAVALYEWIAPRNLTAVMMCRVVVAVSVALLWNFPMQKKFVFGKTI